MEDFPVAIRLRSIIDSLGLSDSQFADRCGISRSTLSLILAGKNKKISDIMLSQIHDAFPKISILWILFGEGERFITEKNDKENLNLGNENQEFQTGSAIDNEDLNLVNVKQLENIIQEVVNKSFRTSIDNIENLILKTSETSVQRKVSKITVYYGDSTFETFIPE